MQGSSVRIAGAEAVVFRCAEGDTILASALRSGLGFPYECNSGGCGTCQFELVEGTLHDAWPQAPGISDRQRGRGRRLACQSLPQGDCTIKVSLDQGMVPPVAPAAVRATLVGRRALTGDMAEFTFRATGRAEFRPGQYAMLHLPGIKGARAYSMCNLANDEGMWSFIIKRVPGGAGTAILFDELQPDGEIRIDGPYGNSYLRTGSGRDIVCIAGGSGISPVLSILRGIAAVPQLGGCHVSLFHGGRGPADMCAGALLDAEPALRGRVALHAAISDDSAPGAAAWTGERGFIHELVRKELGEAMGSQEFYFCGPPPMTDAVHRMLLLEAKVPASQLHFDRFY